MGFFTGKVVIVTGSSNGIGRATAVLFSAAGARVTITGRNAASLEETKEQCLQSGAKEEDILELIGDITDEAFKERLVSATVARFGRIDVLVNNAGGTSYAHFGKDILDIPVEEFDEMINLNVKTVLRLSQLALPHLEKTKGAIVNVSSIGAFHKLTPMPYYSASKSALDQITVQMAGSLIKKEIRVNSVNPGPVQTNAMVTAGSSREEQDKIWEKQSAPLGRIALPEDIGKIILFLADRSQSAVLVGHILTADGGTMIQKVSM